MLQSVPRADEENLPIGPTESAISNLIDRYGNEIQKFAFRRNDVNTALEFVGGLVWRVRLVEAGRHVQPPVAIHLDAIRTTASLPVKDHFAAAWLDRAIRPQPEPPQLAGASRFVVVIVGHVKIFVSRGNKHTVGAVNFMAR